MGMALAVRFMPQRVYCEVKETIADIENSDKSHTGIYKFQKTRMRYVVALGIVLVYMLLAWFLLKLLVFGIGYRMIYGRVEEASTQVHLDQYYEGG